MTKKAKTLTTNKSRILTPKGRGLNLSHRRHSGRRLPHSHTSYPALAMLLLVVGVLLGNTSHLASAATITGSGDYVVTAAYLGPPPATAATIASPTDGSHVSAAPITVSGSCPADTYVTLTRNGVNSGSAICGPLNTYSIQTDLFSGSNALITHVYSKFNVAGPNSNQVIVTYDVPINTPPAANSTPAQVGTGNAGFTQPSNQPGLPLLLKSNFQYVGHSLGQPVSYQFEIIGGTAPYAVSLNWGDGTTSTYSYKNSGPFSVSHTYSKASQYQNSYKIMVTGGDASGAQTFLQALAIVNDRPTVPLASTHGSGNQPGVGFSQQLQNLMKYIWPTYGVILLMFATFWLGELRELDILRHKPGKQRHA